MEKWYQSASDYIRSNREAIVDDLLTLASIPSIAQKGKDSLPFGKTVDDALTTAASMFESSGIPMTVRHDCGYAIGVCPGEGDGIGIFAHADVVPVNDDWIKTAPFTPIEENGILYGRGVNDNKSGIVGSLYALRALNAAGVMLKSRITVYLGGNEEAGMQDMDAFVKNERMPEVSIVPDGGFPVGVGEKGILRMDCRSQHPLQDVRKFEGGDAYNVVLDHVDVELANGEAFAVEGLTAHAAHPKNAINAAGKAAEKLLSMPICENDKAILSALADIVNGCYGEALGISSTGAFGELTCANGITRIEEDGRLLFTLDIRYGTEVDGDDCVKKILAVLDENGFTGTVMDNRPGFLLDENSSELQIILGVCRELFNAPDAKPIRMSGGSYARKLKNAYSVDNAPDTRKGVDLPAGHGGAHQSDEAICVDSLLKGIESLALMIARLDAHLSANT